MLAHRGVRLLRRCYFNVVRMIHTESWLEKFTNYERSGVPRVAGTNTKDGFDLRRMHNLLAALGNPHKDTYKTIHIAGTKGKGSTAAFLSSILQECGYSVGTYSSPHVLSLEERIQLNSKFCSVDDVLEKYVSIIEESHHQERGKLTHFEILTALALKLFQEARVDYAVVEAGLGGARDATNIFSEKDIAAAVITSIGRDHLDALGGSIESVAVAKAGIMKSGRPVIIGFQTDESAKKILMQHAAELKSAPIIDLDSLKGELVPLVDSVPLKVLGQHQKENAMVALAAARLAIDKISMQQALRGLEKTKAPLGRFQLCRHANSENIHVILDGAHTTESTAALIDTARATFPPDTQYALVIAMANDKDHQGILRQFSMHLPHLRFVGFTDVPVAGGRSRSAATGTLLGAWMAVAKRKKGEAPTRTMVQASMQKAIETAVSELKATRMESCVLIVSGSLYAVGAAIRTNLLIDQ